MASPLDLTTVANAKPFCGNAANSDALLGRLITQASRFIYSYLNQPSLLPIAVSETTDGRGSDRWANADGPGGFRMGFSRRPVLSVISLSIDGVAIDPAPDLAPGVVSEGWVLDPWDGSVPPNAQFLTLRGPQRFNRGRRNVTVTYVAGFQVAGEAATIPASPYQLTAAAPFGPWGSDRGVAFADGTALAAVSADPAAGQYSVAAGGAYTFAAADTGKSVLLTYGFIPADIEQACIAIVAEQYSYKDRIGIMSRSLATQESVAYSPKAMTSYVQNILDGYRDPVFA